MAFSVGIRPPHGGIWVLPIMGSVSQVPFSSLLVDWCRRHGVDRHLPLKSRDTKLAEVEAVATV